MGFDAVKMIEYAPPVPTAGVPERRPVDGLNVTPVGSAPLSDSVGVGLPDFNTVKDPGVPTVNVVEFALVMAGGVPLRMLILTSAAFESSVPLLAL